MENKKLLIAGIDPGITTAYAVIDIEGNLIQANSSKQYDLGTLISEIIDLGKVILVGTDKAKVPGMVGSFAVKTGARVVSPPEDLGVDEKRKMTAGFDFEDEHQGDSIASALFAYKEMKPLLDKIDYFSSRNKKQSIRNVIKELVIIRKISIKSAVGIIEAKDEESKIIERAVTEKKLNENDFLKLYNKLKEHEAEIKLLKIHNNNLKNKIAQLEIIQNKAEPRICSKPRADFRDRRIRFLENVVASKGKNAEELSSLIRKYTNVLSNVNDHYILKKLDTLGLNEFNVKNKILGIKRSDILLVEDPNIASTNVVDQLKDKIFVVVYKRQISKKTQDSMPFVFINAKNLKIDEDRHFGFVERKQFDIEKEKINWARKIIEDYRREKGQLIRQVPASDSDFPSSA